MTALRVVRSGPVDPPRNMALDGALLDCAGVPTLRLYGWCPAGISIGYFQEAHPFAAVGGDHVLVRRITGGRAIYHGDELTFALTLVADLLPGDVPASYDLIHGAVCLALAAVGVPVTRSTATGAAGGDSPWCFRTPRRHDIVTRDGRKIAGSAQRRVRRPGARVLHHGSIVVRAPAATPFCGAVADHADPEGVRDDLADALVTALGDELGLEPRDGELTEAELRRAGELEPHHLDPSHVHRR